MIGRDRWLRVLTEDGPHLCTVGQFLEDNSGDAEVAEVVAGLRPGQPYTFELGAGGSGPTVELLDLLAEFDEQSLIGELARRGRLLIEQPGPTRIRVEVVEAGTYTGDDGVARGSVTLNGRVEDLAELALGSAVLEIGGGS